MQCIISSSHAAMWLPGCRFPVNLLFVSMIGSSFYALSLMGVGMVTVWKNLSNVVTACGDVVIFRKRYPWQVCGGRYAGAAVD